LSRLPTVGPLLAASALDYASRHPDEVTERIACNEAAVEASRSAAEGRRSLLA
jgi:hypothetical protein